jgi:hypothetical protein
MLMSKAPIYGPDNPHLQGPELEDRERGGVQVSQARRIHGLRQGGGHLWLRCEHHGRGGGVKSWKKTAHFKVNDEA